MCNSSTRLTASQLHQKGLWPASVVLGSHVLESGCHNAMELDQIPHAGAASIIENQNDTKPVYSARYTPRNDIGVSDSLIASHDTQDQPAWPYRISIC